MTSSPSSSGLAANGSTPKETGGLRRAYMFALALVPPLWFAVMDPRTVAWADGDFSRLNVLPEKRDSLARRYAATTGG